MGGGMGGEVLGYREGSRDGVGKGVREVDGWGI